MSDYTKTPITIEQVKKTRQAFQSALESGQIVSQKALITKQIEAVSSESGTIQETPFIMQGTGTANGTSIVDTSPVGKHLEKQGNTVVVNQKVTDTLKSTTVTVENDLTGTTWLETHILVPAISTAQVGHKLLFIAKGTSSTIKYAFLTNGKTFTGTGIYTVLASDLYNTVPPQMALGILGYSGLTAGTYTLEIAVFDLTQWFGSNDNIPQDLLDHPENAARYGITSDIGYNTGELKNSDGRYLECGQSRNVWDEEWELGNISTSTGEEIVANNLIRNKGYIRVIPNNTYYIRVDKSSYSIGNGFRIYFYDAVKQFISANTVYSWSGLENVVIPSNCIYLRFSLNTQYGTTYNNDITISLYYTTGDSYDQYFSYIAPKTYDTGTERLDGFGTARDRKLPSGIIVRVIKTVDLGSLNWTVLTTNIFVCNNFPSDRVVSGYGTVSNARCSVYRTGGSYGSGDAALMTSDKTYYGNYSYASIVYIKDTAYTDAAIFKAAMSGIMLYYETATPTTEQGTPFSENIEINDYSYMAWRDTDSDLVEIPQGCKIFYPADYVLFIDSLGQREDIEWDASVLAVKNDTKLYKHNVYLHLYYQSAVDVRLYLSFMSNSSVEVDDSFIDANFDIMQVDTKNSIDESDFTTKPIKLLECAFATGGGTCKVLEWTGSAVIEKELTGNGAADTVTEFLGS